jgi:hypothetical protein
MGAQVEHISVWKISDDVCLKYIQFVMDFLFNKSCNKTSIFDDFVQSKQLLRFVKRAFITQLSYVSMKFKISSNLMFNHPVVWRCIFWATDGVVN